MHLAFGTPTQHKLIIGDTLEMLRTLPDESVHCCVTSPPYWGLRDYGHDGQIGLEPTPEAYVARMVEVFREVRRVLRDDGTLWLNLGDSYHGGGGGNYGDSKSTRTHKQHLTNVRNRIEIPGLKPKDLVGIPWRVAFALQADGWWLRQDIIWHKPNPMPESVRDRCTKAHEYVFLLTKSERYFYDAEALKEKSTTTVNRKTSATSEYKSGRTPSEVCGKATNRGGKSLAYAYPNGIPFRNRRSVWTITTKPYKGAHFATMPPDLAKTCILAATSGAGCCSQCGEQFERVVERKKSFESGSGKSGNSIEGKQDLSGSESHSTPDVRMGPVISTQTIGWKQSCNCTASAVPCVVLDPFGGSGTTNSVAKSLGHNSIYIELNPEYEPLARSRIDSTKPGFLAS